ncbi:MAG TPA: fused MFS/spermidine synthase [Longimicrobiales bacterium]|nr:fused MFS/spermidine synthase [Longimicrobiales bacterium]
MAAALLFLVQPMVGKMVLPRAGGSPQVWNTSLVFFQTALLVGYLYAHLSVRWLGVRRQALLHLVLLALPALVLPIALPGGAPRPGGGQSWWVLATLAVAVGLPFVVLSTASPLLQRWLADTEHAHAADPYFLYAGSNAGSLVGLLVFPLVLEPLLPLTSQSRLWALGYLVFVALAAACALVVVAADRRARRNIAATSGAGPSAPIPETVAQPARGDADVTARDRLFWIASAAVPSALLLGVTQYLTSQIAPISLLWVLPLGVYLGTFIVAFARRQLISPERLSRLLAIVAVVAALVLLARIVDPQWVIALLHLSLLALGGLLCHVRLAQARPPTSHLTEYYLLISTGGAIGGSLAALAAPVLFDFIAEYPIAVALACMFRMPFGGAQSEKGLGRFLYQGQKLDLVLPAILALYLLTAVGAARAIGDFPDGAMVLLVAVLPTIVVFTFSPRPVRFALGLAVLLAAAESGQMYRGQILHTDRTFFGVHRVTRDPDNTVTVLYHGSTVHGVQSVDPARATEPLAYYHPTGPAGNVVSAFASRPEKRELALVGAGTGALAVLAGAHQRVTLYEIDPEVVWIADESGLFTYLDNTRAAHEWVVGDGRIELERTTARFDLIVLDAFSSGTIPIHLLTHEAFELYLERLTPGGALLFHISNRHLGLAPVLGAHARDLGLAALEWIDVRADEDVERGIFGSHWVLIAPPHEGLAYIPQAGWGPLAIPMDTRAWTDDFSDLLSVQRWN